MAKIAAGTGTLVTFMILIALGCGRGGPYPLPLVGFKVEFGEQNIPIRMVADKTWYQLRIGRLASRAEAVKLQDILKVKEHLKRSFVASSR